MDSNIDYIFQYCFAIHQEMLCRKNYLFCI